MINRFYYSKCTDIEKRIYTIIWKGLSEFQEMIFFERTDAIAELISRVFTMVLYDNPRIFYTSTMGYQIGFFGNLYYLKPKYFFSLHAVLELQSWIDERLDEICKPIRYLEDTFSKEIYIHNYLIKNVKYSKVEVSQPVNAYTIAGALLENRSVCSGVALTFKLFMDYLDIPCIVAIGDITIGEEKPEKHAWNIVCIENDYYQIDVTWDFFEENGERIIRYDYFNLTLEEMYTYRVPDYEYPKCTHREFNYFYYLDAIVYSPEELRVYVSDRIKKRERIIYFKYMFDFNGMKNNLNKYLRGMNYRYSWVNEMEHTILIMR